MASITSLMGSSSSISSLYGKSNAISGLASGMDTEAMIENAVAGIKTKLENFNKDRTKLEWEQDAYRSITDKLIAFSDKYTPKFTDSSTDLLTGLFFNSATKVNVVGENKDMISAVGKSSSEIKITAATMATKATCSGSALTRKDGGDVTKNTKLSELDYGSKDLSISGSFVVNGHTIECSENDTLASVAQKISDKTGLEAGFSETSGSFYIRSKGTGENQKIEVSGGDAKALFGRESISVIGKDAQVSMMVNGQAVKKEYHTNQIDLDGMIVTLKGNFGDISAEPTENAKGISFTTTTDTDKIIDVIKSMVEDFNTVANEIKDAYSTKPLKDSKGKRYEPLTDEDAKDMSESTIEKYEEKAKTGLLFADGDLSALYNELRAAANALGYANIGITAEYEMSTGKTTLKLDEEKLRSTLEADPDKVKDVFTKGITVKRGNEESTVHGMQMMQDTLLKYAKSVGEKGILIKLAGTTKLPATLNDNTYKDKMDDMNDLIKRWEEKLTRKVDYYSKQFTTLEKMISNMNSQSSALSGLMGY